MSFDVIPAIDLRGGRCVRLVQGDYGRETVYHDDPAGMARRWQSLGARRLHVVDLDGARSGEPVNSGAVRKIVGAVTIPVELGGGVRDIAAIARWLELGVERVYLGTAAVQDPELVVDACGRFPGRIAAAADAREGRIVVRGWQEDSAETTAGFVRRMAAAGVVAVSYTDIARDGTFLGADIEGVARLIGDIAPSPVEVILAGGVGSLADVLAASRVPGLHGVIVGRALYEGRLDLAEALAALSS